MIFVVGWGHRPAAAGACAYALDDHEIPLLLEIAHGVDRLEELGAAVVRDGAVITSGRVYRREQVEVIASARRARFG